MSFHVRHPIARGVLLSLLAHGVLLSLLPPYRVLPQQGSQPLSVRLLPAAQPVALTMPPRQPEAAEQKSRAPGWVAEMMAGHEVVAVAAPPQSSGGYQPAALLTQPPRPLYPIDLNGDEMQEHALAGQFNLRIYVNEAGTVDFVESAVALEETEGGEFLKAVRQKFLVAQFIPGQIGNIPIKSRLDIRIDAIQLF